MLVVWSVDALFLQAQMAALDSTPLPNFIVKAVLTLLVLAGGLSRMVSGSRGAVPRPIFALWLGFVTYLVVATPILVLRFGYSVGYVLFVFSAYHFSILLLPFFFHLRQTLDESIITRTLLIFFVPLGLLGMAQHFSGNVLLPTMSPNAYLRVMTWNFYGSIRAFSLFSSPSYFGHFIAFIGGLGMAFCLEKNGTATTGYLIVLLALICGYCTLTRATQLEIACAMFTVWALYRRARYRLLISLSPILYGIFGVFIALVLPIWLKGVSHDNLLSSRTLFERNGEWARCGVLWLGNGLSTFLLGAGLAQNDRFQTSANVLIDNSFLAMGVHIGIIGLTLWLAITWYVWAYMLAQSRKSFTPVRAAATGAWSVWLFTSVFNVTLFFTLPFVVFLLSTKQWGTPVAPVLPTGISRQDTTHSLGSCGLNRRSSLLFGGAT